MIVRLVRLTLTPDALDQFHLHFNRAAPHIRTTPGCLTLDLWTDARYPNIVCSYSEWESEQALNAYRNSEFFASVWADVKPLFAAPPEAYTYRLSTTPAAPHGPYDPAQEGPTG